MSLSQDDLNRLLYNENPDLGEKITQILALRKEINDLDKARIDLLDQQCLALLEALNIGGTKVEFSALLGVSRQTLDNMLHKFAARRSRYFVQLEIERSRADLDQS